MSPRSQELMDDAHARLEAARTNFAARFAFVAVGQAYYAMLYAARAALSERDSYAKTHSGTWTLFSQTFVLPGAFPAQLSKPVDKIREQQEQADYQGGDPTLEEAAEAVEHAERFVAAIEEMVG